MGVQIKDYNLDKGTMEVQYVPEIIHPKTASELSDFKKENLRTNGYGEDRTTRLVGRVPLAFMYNYCGLKGIPANKMMEYFNADNGKNMTLLLEEFNAFRMVDVL